MTAIDPRRSLVAIAIAASLTLAVVGCTPTAPATEPGTTDTAENPPAEETSAAGPACEDNTDGYELFTAAGVSDAPEYGQVWGDGSELSFSYDGFIEGATVGYQISYVQDNGSVIPVTGGFFAEPTGTTFSSSDPYFDSTSAGYYGIVFVTMTSNVEFDGENYTSDNTDVANFCVLLATSE